MDIRDTRKGHSYNVSKVPWYLNLKKEKSFIALQLCNAFPEDKQLISALFLTMYSPNIFNMFL